MEISSIQNNSEVWGKWIELQMQLHTIKVWKQLSVLEEFNHFRYNWYEGIKNSSQFAPQ